MKLDVVSPRLHYALNLGFCTHVLSWDGELLLVSGRLRSPRIVNSPLLLL